LRTRTCWRAAIYKQAEQSNLVEDYRAAANHFLRIKAVAPTSSIRSAAEYDAGAALMRLEDWTAAASVLEEFRSTDPDHELSTEATKQLPGPPLNTSESPPKRTTWF
jgi:outer membrane protein assembly factor BamD (BamD/ComL family)